MSASLPLRHRLARRRLLAGLCSAGALSLAGCALNRGATRSMRVTLSGQMLIAHDLCAAPYEGFREVVDELRRGDVVFTDLETAIRSPGSGAPTRDTQFLHVAGLPELQCVRDMGFHLLALSNNHAWDLGTDGVLETRNAVSAQGFGHAGTGETLSVASQSGSVRDVALIAMATGKIREGAAATATRAGVNELRLGADNRLNREDMERNLEAIRTAAGESPVVIAYLHNHEWGDDMAVIQPWSRDWAHTCVDAGATIFASHGAPLLRGIEWYHERPVFHGLGSLVFHSRTAIGHYPPAVWESAIVHCEFAAGSPSVEIVPVMLNERGDDPSRQYLTRGRPRIAHGADAQRILSRLSQLSTRMGTPLRIRGERGWIER